MHQRVHGKYNSVMDCSCFTHSAQAHLQVFTVSYVKMKNCQTVGWRPLSLSFTTFLLFSVCISLPLSSRSPLNPLPHLPPRLRMWIWIWKCGRAGVWEQGQNQVGLSADLEASLECPSYASQMACRTRPLEVAVSDTCLNLKHPPDSQNNTLGTRKWYGYFISVALKREDWVCLEWHIVYNKSMLIIHGVCRWPKEFGEICIAYNQSMLCPIMHKTAFCFTCIIQRDNANISFQASIWVFTVKGQ